MNARRARKLSHARTPKSERVALAIRLLAIGNAKRAQKAYRMRGITDPCVKAREARSRYCKQRREAKAREVAEGQSPIVEHTTRTRSKVLVNW